MNYDFAPGGGALLQMAQTTRDIVVIGASAGGVQALQRLVSGLPGDFPSAVFVVLHLWPGTQSFLASILDRAGRIRVTDAKNDAPIERGKIFVAPADFHLLLEDNVMRLVHGPRENRARPAINPLFRSAAAMHRNRVVGVILTGTLDDGAAGLWAVKQCGGMAVVQSDAAFDQMPRSAVESVAVDYHIPLDEIPNVLNRLAREQVDPLPGTIVPEIVRKNDDGAKMKPSGFNLDEVGRRSVFSCPECNGALWELDEGVLEYRCHVGHAYSGESLKDAQGTNIEQSLWSALRALKESAALDARLAERAAQHNLDKAAEAYRENASAKTEQIAHLQEFLGKLRPQARPDSGKAVGM
jgi:two-component system, chemotaxis family, protein-glutamate methylesterase/glutaminase